MGSACCTRNDVIPETIALRNTEKRSCNNYTEDITQPLIDTTDMKDSIEFDVEGTPTTPTTNITLDSSAIISYILSPQITTFDLIEVWRQNDVDNTDEINIHNELQNIFLIFIHHYIRQQPDQKTNDTQFSHTAHALSNELSIQFQSILANYHYIGDVMTRDFFLENVQKYLAEPNPEITNGLTEEIESDHDESTVFTEQYPQIFDMLSFISTSPTIKPDPATQFQLDYTVRTLQDAMRINKKNRGQQVGEILSALTVPQRIAVRNNFIGSRNQALHSALEDNFSGDLLLILTQLCRSSAVNDAEWIEKCRHKLNVNTSVINEILMSRTNSQLLDIKQAYKKRFGRDLLHCLLQSFHDNGSYGSLLKLVLTDNAKILRKECAPRGLNEKKVRDDAKILYHLLENTKGKLNKLKIIEMFCHRSWCHIARLCKEYGQKSKYDLKTMIEKKFGKNSKSGDALQKIIDVSRNKHSFFAQLLFQSMKGISVNQEMLIRIVVGRSSIDLGEIAAEFCQKYGNGKTLLQFIKANASKGTYRNILLRICAIGDNALNDALSDYDGNEEEEEDCKVLENASEHSLSYSHSMDDDEKFNRMQTWEEYIASSATIHALDNFDSNATARELIAVMDDKKKKKDAKKLLIQTLTMINNRQRQELKRCFVELHPKGMELAQATQDTLRKGKTMIVMLGLLQRQCEFNCFWVKQAIKSKKIELLVEILCSSSNYEIKKMQDFYKKSENSDLIKDIEKVIGNKKTAKYLLSKILQCKRPETINSDKKLCKIHLTEMHKLLKQKNQKACKQFFAKLFVENSYSQIKYEMNKFNTVSEHTLSSVVKKIMGSGASGIVIENIIKIANNRFDFFAGKLRESMKGITTSEHILIRILVGRAEKDLGDIVQYFAEYGEGKTLKQWIESTLKGSFRTSLLRIANLSEQYANDDIETDFDDYESQTESDYPVNKNGAVVLKSTKVNKPTIQRYATSPNRQIGDVKIVVSSPEVVENEVRLQKMMELQDEKEVNDAYDPYDVNEFEFGGFIIDKVNEKTSQRLMQHLKRSKKRKQMVGDDDVIKASQCIHVLLFACVLFLKYKEKTEERAVVQIDKKKLKKKLVPAVNWMLENKLERNGVLQKSQYKVLGTWLQQYYQEIKY